MKPDEREFLRAVYQKPEGVFVRDLIGSIDMPNKRCWYLLDKWVSKGWYEYGVALDLGWLTDKGKAAAAKMIKDEA